MKSLSGVDSAEQKMGHQHGLLDLLMMDHQKLRSVYQEIKKECDRHERDNDFCLDTMESLRILIVAHSKAEEMALYNVCDTLRPEGTVATRRELQDRALQGHVEHGLIERLLEQLQKFDEADDDWKAHFFVLAELLDKHLGEEEKDFFKKVAVKFQDSILVELAEVYTEERDTVLRREIARARRPSSRTRMREMLGVEAAL